METRKQYPLPPAEKGNGDENQGDPAKPKSSFLFIEDTSLYSTAVRSHAMSSSWRRRRGIGPLRKDQHKAQLSGTRPLLPNLSAAPLSMERGSVLPVTRSATPVTPSNWPFSRRNLSASQENVTKAEESTAPSHAHSAEVLRHFLWNTLSPRSILDPNTLDPFSLFPIALDAVDRKLLSWFLGPGTVMLYGSQNDSNGDHHFTRLYMYEFEDPANLHGVLVYAAMQKSAHGIEKHDIKAVFHRMKAVQLINEQLSNSVTAMSDQTLGAVARMVTNETWWGESDASEIHLKALRDMIQLRGGPKSFGHNFPLEKTCVNFMLIRRPKWSYSAIFSNEIQTPTNDTELGLPARVTLRPSSRILRQSCKRLVDLFMEFQAIAQMASPKTVLVTRISHRCIHDILQMASRNFQADRPHYTDHVNITLGFVLQLYFSLYIKDSQSSSKSHPLDHLELNLQNSDPATTKNLSIAIQSVQKIEHQMKGNLDRFWEILKFMDVARLLPWELWYPAQSFLHELMCGNNLTDLKSPWQDIKILHNALLSS